MCGLAGFLRAGGELPPDSEVVLRQQSGCLTHRGPDGDGHWLDRAAGIALGHRRLAIIDLSDAGKQPMHSASSRFVIAYNGEIYNHLEMRASLAAAGAAPAWRGHSDTETLLAGFDHWGIEETLQRAHGMFAIALWDCHTRQLTLARDRLGEKPLYYGWQGDTLLFASELKALRAHPRFRGDIDTDSLATMLRVGYVPAPASIYRGIRKLMPGCWLSFPASGPAGLGEPESYWSLRDVAKRGDAGPFQGSDTQATDTLESELRRAVHAQTIADVPLGAFLSGGIDSTIVVAMLQAQSPRRVKTFSIGFNEAQFQEAQHAAAVARHLGTDHSELYVTAADALKVIPALPEIYDEPFGDSSAIPTHLVSRFARQHVTVCLSGDGGDELFGGYTRYQESVSLWQQLRRVPSPLRSVISGGYRHLSRSWRAQRLADYLSARDADGIYSTKIALWPASTRVVRQYSPRLAPAGLSRGHPLERMMFHDAVTYLPDDILAKVDRAAMAVSLETRIPLLDPRVVEFAWSLPLHLKLRDGRGKWLLRQVLARHVPDSLMDRPKMGFGVPVGEWMRGPLRAWAEDLLDPLCLERDGFLDAAPVRERWAAHLSGAVDAADTLWPVLMFQSWRQSTATPAAVAG